MFHYKRKTSGPQGIELDSNGKLVGRPRGAELQQIREEQEGWGASSEKASRAFLENLAVTGAKAAGNAGTNRVCVSLCLFVCVCLYLSLSVSVCLSISLSVAMGTKVSAETRAVSHKHRGTCLRKR